MANLECQHFPDVGKQHAHTCSAFARLRLGSSCGAHKWYQYPRVTRTGHLKAVLGGSDWLPSPTHRPPRLTGEKIRSTYKGAPFCSLVMRRMAQLDTEDRVYGLLTPKVANALGSRGVHHQVPPCKRDNFLERHAGTDGCSAVEQSSAQYRKFADECRRLAKFVQRADERKVLQEMAAAWTKVAEEVEGEAGKNGI